MSGQLPICCEFDDNLLLFRVTRCRGKTLAVGGFGVFVSTAGLWLVPRADDDDRESSVRNPMEDESEGYSNLDDSDQILKGKTGENPVECSKKTRDAPQHHLFIEEVLFLHEKGLIDIYKSIESDNNIRRIKSSFCFKLKVQRIATFVSGKMKTFYSVNIKYGVPKIPDS